MIPITVYRASDGQRFDNPEQCGKHEDLLDKIDAARQDMPDTPLGHGKYIKVDPAVLRNFKARIWALVQEEYGGSYPEWLKWKAWEVHPQCIVGRVLSDGSTPLYRPWCKLMCCDFETGRVYDQPYFTEHPDEAEPE